jgi:hypothetical protein
MPISLGVFLVTGAALAGGLLSYGEERAAAFRVGLLREVKSKRLTRPRPRSLLPLSPKGRGFACLFAQLLSFATLGVTSATRCGAIGLVNSPAMTKVAVPLGQRHPRQEANNRSR